MPKEPRRRGECVPGVDDLEERRLLSHPGVFVLPPEASLLPLVFTPLSRPAGFRLPSVASPPPMTFSLAPSTLYGSRPDASGPPLAFFGRDRAPGARDGHAA